VPRVGNMFISSGCKFPFLPGAQTCVPRFAIRASGKPAHVRDGLIGSSLRAQLEWSLPVREVAGVSQRFRHLTPLPLGMGAYEIQVVAVGDRHAL